MPWREALSPMRMERVALVSPVETCRTVLEEVARQAVVELDLPYQPGDGDDEIDRAVAAAVVSGPVAGLVGWTATRDLPALATAVAVHGASVVPLVHSRGVDPPTLLVGAGRPRLSRTLVDTYGTVPYADVDPSRLAAFAYVVMFGMMFGDVGHGVVLVAFGLVLRGARFPRLVTLRRAWLFVTGAGLTSIVFGALYGEAFGPTGLVPVLWLEPLTSPVSLMLAALVVGAVLLGGAYALGTINRVREGGWAYALYARTGVAGSALFIAVGLAAWGITASVGPLVTAGGVLAAVALALILAGLVVEAGGGATGIFQAVIEWVDTVARLGSNIVSFARLAAFGLTHAALLSVVWSGTTALWAPDWRAVAAVLVFVLGNVLTFALEALVAGIQALRLEYYELFSRVFLSEGRPFRAWAPAIRTVPAEPGSNGPTTRTDSTTEGNRP
ncbi:MAG TPA: V-type ATPase 116kDa subunit family protein [Cellulomonadaceae bacterium]|nr:V-type ATPase 116kDa subunit family protein [Cellulomonadaceae bacterium]